METLDALGKQEAEENRRAAERNEWSSGLSFRRTVFASVGICLATACVGWLSTASNTLLVLGSFGSSCVLLFAYPRSPFSRPRNFVAGHFISSLVGLSFLHAVGPQWWAMALATGTAFAAMMITRTIHPPAGSNPLIVYLSSADWSFVWMPTLLGALVIQAVACAHHFAQQRVQLRLEENPARRGTGNRLFVVLAARLAQFRRSSSR